MENMKVTLSIIWIAVMLTYLLCLLRFRTVNIFNSMFKTAIPVNSRCAGNKGKPLRRPG
jgi:hypothetical protein